MAYAQVLTPEYLIQLEYGNTNMIITAGKACNKWSIVKIRLKLFLVFLINIRKF